MKETDGGSWVLRTQRLRREYGREASLVRAVDGIDLDVARGRTVAINGAERLRQVHPAVPARRAVLGTLLAVAGLTTVPALVGARIPTAQILQSETP